MTHIDTTRIPTPRTEIDTLIARHGRWRILRAVAAALIRANRPPPLGPEDFSPHLRRDLGLESPPPSPTWRDFL